MPNPVDLPEQPAWSTESLPAGLRWLDAPAPSPFNFVINANGSVAPEQQETERLISLDDYATVVKYPRRLHALTDWARAYNLSLEMVGVDRIMRDGTATEMTVQWYVYTTFRVHESRPTGLFEPRRWLEVRRETECGCGGFVAQGTLRCPHCVARIACVNCGYSTNPIIFDEGFYCLGCATPCTSLGCGRPCSTEWNTCLDHRAETARCENCNTRHYVSTYEGRSLCDNCVDFLCSSCMSRNHDEYYLDDLGYVCRACYDSHRFEAFGPDFQNTEAADADTNVDDFTIPTIEGRELIRHCGIEIEGGGAPDSLIAPMRAAGLTNQTVFNGYHHQSRYAPSEVTDWSIEHDGSVDWELVSPRLNMADPGDVRSLDTAVRTLRTAVHDGDVSLDMRCGLHIHVSAMRIPVGGAYRLKGYWDYLEDVMFRLGAARWPFHRAVMNGGEYTRNTPKNGMSSKLDFARHFERNNDRYYALSFANYFRAFLENCQCGAARYDTWDNCTCDLGKCTFEFRVFNTSANPTKIHAYLALCQALVAKAAGGEDIENIQALLPPMSFDPIIYDKASSDQKQFLLNEWEPRLRWIFTELPLTDAEKQSVMYCVENSELANLDRGVIRSFNPDQFAMEVGA